MQGQEVQNALVRKKEESKEFLSTFDTRFFIKYLSDNGGQMTVFIF